MWIEPEKISGSGEKKKVWRKPFCSACMFPPHCRAPTQLRVRPQPSFQTCVTDPAAGNSTFTHRKKNHLNAFVDVSHPLLLLCCSCRKNCKGLAPENSAYIYIYNTRMASEVHLVHRSQPFLNCPSSSKDFNLTSSRGIKCCKGPGRFDKFKK